MSESTGGNSLPKMNQVEPPKDERSIGEASFNYASHDGRYVIGTEPWMFETHWSSAGQGAAHLYNDPVGIEGVAIAEGVATIGQVTPDVVAAADFTSRTRTPHVGQVALLRNTAGFYAAIELLDVGYSDKPSANVMHFRFAISTDGATDFTPFASSFNDRQAMVDQLLAAATVAEKALLGVPVEEDVGRDDTIGIGHNQPPAEFVITKEDQAETLGAIAIIKEEAVRSTPSASRLRTAGKTVALVAAKLAKWISSKADVAADEFSKAVGKTAGVAVAGTVWLVLHDKLNLLIELLSRFMG